MTTPLPVYICLGSNVPDCESRLADAAAMLCERLRCTRLTPGYYTEAEGAAAGCVQRRYCNAVMYGVYDGSLDDLHSYTKQVETVCGRRRGLSCPPGEVAMDIDIVIASGVVLRPHDRDAHYFRLGYERLMQL